ncbi:UNVERIFIED_CONTAM: hypothetical protein FKN15_074218 [Acipenser sinensis]
MPGKQEQLQAIYRILEQLPQANYNTLERLVFHLVRVAKEEPHNRMTPNALAIVYAPCILRCPDNADPLTSMKDVAKTTMCVEMLINEQIRKYNERIEEIEQLEYAEALAVNQLKLKRQNTLWPLELRFSPYKGVVVNEKSSVDLSPVHEDSPTDSDIEAEKTLMQRIKSIKEEKEEIVYRLPELEQPGSDQENLDSEASLSTESLLDERTGNLDSEGPAKRLGKQKSHPVAKPPRSFLHNSRALLVQSNSSLPPPTVRSSSATLHGTKLPQRAPTMPTSNIKLPPGILTRTSSQTLPLRNAVVLRLVKGREQPAQRKDSIQSVYVVPGQDPFPAQPRPVDCHPSAAVCRSIRGLRFFTVRKDGSKITMTGDKKKKKRLSRSNLLSKKIVIKDGGTSQGMGEPSVYHAVVVIFLEFFAWGLLTTPMLTVLHQTFPQHTFLMNGLIHGVKGLLSFLSAPLIGALSDVWGRKSFLLLTVFFTCAPIPLMRISPWWYFAVISMSGVFAVTFSVIFAYVADITQEHERSTAYGLVSATFAASLVTSPAIGAYLSREYGDAVVVILATAIALLDICFILVAVPESLPEKMRPASWGAPISWEQADPFASLRKVGQDSTVLLICITVFLSYLPEAGQYSSFFLYLRQVSATFAASLVTSPAIGAYLSREYGDAVVVILATAIALLDICFILVAVPESLPEKMRPASWGAPISWEQADPFASLRKVGQDSTVLLICITVFLSYLPEAGQYSSFFLYLRQVIGFTSETVAAFIAVVGILSILAQTAVLGVLMRSIGNKNTILLGLGFQILQLAWYGFGSQPWMMWAAGALAAMSSITFPAISAIVSRNADPDQQGVVQGMVTGIRGLCNGLGPALYGFVFYLFHVELCSSIIPGPPFLFGACSVLLSILVALFIPEHSGPNVRPGSYKRHSNGAQSHYHSPQPGVLDSKEPLLEDSNV